jgi:flagellar hook-associated protein 2
MVTATSSGTGSSATSAATAASVIQSIGIGTTLPISQVLSGLLQIDSIPLVNLQKQVTGVQTEISAYGTLSSALATFQTAVQQLTLPSEFSNLSATSSNTSVLSASATVGATLGNYAINVTALAQAQSLATAGQTSLTTALSSGTTVTNGSSAAGDGSATVTFNFGTNNSNGSFTANPAQSSTSITLNSSDNTLSGIADAINGGNLGVTATIVNNGSATAPYQLVITSNSTGAAQAVQISVSGDSGLSSLLTYPPATGTPAGTGPTQTVAAQNAALTINGIALSSASNTISSSVTGLTLNLTQTGTTTLNVANNTSTVQTNIDNFVSAYNTLQASIDTLTKYNPSGTNGELIGDPTTLQIQSSLQQIVSGALSGTGSSSITSLGDIGITVNVDGSLSVNDSTLSKALAANPTQFAGIFATAGTSTSSNLTYLVGGSATQSGSYAINVTHAATTATAVGGGAPTSLVVPSGSTLAVTLDGVTANVAIPAATYASSSDLATAIQTAINTNATFQASSLSTNVTVNSSGALQIAGTDYGSQASISVSGTAAAQLFGGSVTATTGTDVQGTINGQVATGSGQQLTGATGTPGAGLTVQVNGTATGNVGTINYSEGYAAQLNAVLTAANSTTAGANGSTGPIAAAVATLNTQISALQTQETATQAYITSVQAQYQAEFSALDATLAQLTNTSSFLQQTFNPTTTSS